jgi:hypothetical protein
MKYRRSGENYIVRSLMNSPPNTVREIKLRRMRQVGHVVHMGEGIGMYMVLVGNSEGKRPLGRPRHRWEDNTKMDLKERGMWGYGLD